VIGLARCASAALSISLLAAAACAKREARNDETGQLSAQVFVSAQMRGYLGPCGCTEAMRGGVDRAAFQIAQARKNGRPVLYIDGGDALFGRSSLSDAEIPQEERKARAIAEAFKWMKLAAHAFGELDDVRGAEFRKSLGLPDQLNGTVRLFELAGRKIGVAAGASRPELVAAARAARQQGAAFVIGLLQQPIQQAQQVASDPSLEADLLFATHQANELDSEDNQLVKTAVPVAQVQSKGRSLARVDLAFAATPGKFELQRTQDDLERELAALSQRIELLKKEVNTLGTAGELKKLKQGKLEELVARRQSLAAAPVGSREGKNAFAVRFVPLESSLPSQPEIKALVAQYDREVGLINLEWARRHGRDCPPPEKGEAAFVGNAPCRECHAESFPVWEQSKHAHAYQTLADLGRQYDLSCVGCHVTGFQRPGGVCRVDKVQNRIDVGCESCHGPGSVHTQDPTRDNVIAKPEKSDCVRCHTPENSTHFDFASYLPQILGPGHQASARKSGENRRARQ
jgi:hypothetical protein